jgi:ATP-dependent RNA helicase DeaD
VVRLAAQFMHQPGFLNLSSDHVHVTEVEHAFYVVPGMDRDRTLVRILEIENPAAALIFCNTKQRVEYVATVLQRFGFDADMITSDLSQAARDRVMARIRAGNLRFLVATDVAARGIDLPELSHVIQYEPPEDPESYIHRAGRTGRAGASGTAITLVTSVERPALTRIGARFSISLQERPAPTDEEVETIVAERIAALLETRLRERDRLKVERMQRFLPLARQMAEGEDAALLAMLLDDFYADTFHAALAPADEPVPDSAPHHSRPPRPAGDKPRRRSGGRR